MPRFLLGILLIVGLSACASSHRQTNALLEDRLANSEKYVERSLVENVPFVLQSKDYCGPASLSMVMNWAGKAVSVDKLGEQTFTPGKSGTFQLDLLSASRRNGFLAVPVRGLPALVQELEAGHPVIVMQNLALSWYPKWHYAVALGYDLNKVELTLHSGSDAFKKTNLKDFEETWALADYWGLVVLPPGQLAASADDLAHAAAAAGLEQIGKTSEAEMIYKNVLKRWPQSLSALIGLGNTRYAAGDFKSSVFYLTKATELYPNESSAWHNLSVAQEASQMKAKESSDRAQALSSKEN